MEDRLARLESELDGLSRTLKRLEERVESLEKGRGIVADASISPEAAAGAVAGPSDSEIVRGITFLGRTLLVLGGAYLLRFLTESGAVAPLSGVTLGLLYALVWLFVADRAGAKSRSFSAAFHGAAAVLVAFPLLWETTVRFQLLSPPWAAAGLALVSAVAVTVAWLRRLRTFAWVTVVGATLTSLLLLVGTRDLFWFSLVVVLVSVATLWLSYHSNWPAVHWIVAGLADVTVALVTVGVFTGHANVQPATALIVQLALFALFLGSFLKRVVTNRYDPGPFEIVQTGAVTLIGYGGALLTATAPLRFVLGGLGVALGVAGYALAFTSKAAPRRSERSTLYLSGIAFLLLLLGSTAVPWNATLSFCLYAVGLSWIGSQFARPVYRLHGTAFVLAAAISSGLLPQAAVAFFAPASYAWPEVGFWILVSWLTAALAYSFPPASQRETDPWWIRWRVSRLLDLAVAVAALGGILLALAAPWTSGRAGREVDAAILATLRTAVLGLSALALGLVGRWERFREASWLVYPMLVLGGIKLAVEDFPQGRPATLFMGLALYGGALILAPRAARSSK